MPSLYLAEKKTKKDKKDILARILNRLLDDKDCYYSNGREWKPLTPEQKGNWKARHSMMKALAKI